MSDVFETDKQGKELLQSLTNDFSTLTIEYKYGTICVRMLGFWSDIASKSTGEWVVNEEVKAILPNFSLFKKLESELIGKNLPTVELTCLLITQRKGLCMRRLTQHIVIRILMDFSAKLDSMT